ncbi:ACP S-malonyltransferase [Anaplasma phagocytophilum]|uniref:ACP S-malonyltransferase n=1 Tax=Anaplasma phagocytophilum TaxID=948 RepID=UPI0007E218B5|nr:ACP S-malonyltransferase [Anaplasma phagocytophilum]SBO31178.1 Malonyl CoA-acyl carrier protein transacylase [Anaplasma phagocytophilum]SBO31395.1 Malonyl CoA-acyl carrier protein transacylase [Anaplasma phagocytophilum]SBO31451.1 Malonyl CoA-acyl carrier protein transacylase [Anaplasma phagocytophilum]SCV65032.1 Malonyl CoA-acyl carrier protein transacylase [Anaplasma phagocytophilum]
MSTVFMFPGQGSQFVGMGKEVYENFAIAREVFHEVDETLGRNLSDIIFNGPEEVLTSTCNAQLALMTVSIAVVRAVEHVVGMPLDRYARYVIGHSVGEYAALCAAGVINLPTAVKLLDVRSRAMGKASEMCQGGMSALIGGCVEDVEAVVQAASKFGVCEIANDNCNGQIVVSGTNEALEALPELVVGTAIRRVIRLRVSGPFHSSLMHPAYEELRDFVSTLELKAPKIGIVYNVSASEHEDCDVIKDLMARQVVSRVRWRESIEYLLGHGCSEFVEAGPGEVLTGLLRRIDRTVRCVSVCAVDAMRELSQYAEVREFC